MPEVTPLTWVTPPEVIVAFGEIVNVGTRLFTFVPKGTVAVIFVPEIVAVTIGFKPLKLNVVIAFSVLFGGAIVTVTV